MRRPSLLAAAAAALIVSSLPVTAVAAPTLTLNALSVKVDGTTLTVTANVAASSSTSVDAYGVCSTQGSAGPTALGERRAATIPTTGLTTRVVVDLAPGAYAVGPCVTVGGRTTLVGVPKAVTVATPPPKVLFSDDFDGQQGARPDPSRWGEWSACTYNGSAAYGSIKCGERSSLDGAGHLVVPATPDAGTSISTAGRFSFTYGVVTARMKVPSEGGYWPAFWTLNNNPTGRPNDSTVGEVDVLESYTSLANGYRRAVHHWSGASSWSPTSGPICGLGHVLGEWHDYSARIEPGLITFYFDGQQCGEVTSKGEGAGRPYAFGPDITRGNWLLLTLAVGGAGGQQDGKAVAPARLLVDRVTVQSL